MAYPANVKGFTRAVTDNIFTFSCPMTILGLIHVGARMTLIKTSDSTYAIYSAAPYQPSVVNSFDELLRGLGHLKSDESFVDKVTAIIIPNIQHTIAIPGWHAALTEKGIKPSIIGPHKCFESVKCLVNVQIPKEYGHKSLSGSDLVQFGLDSNDPLVTSNNFNFMYFPGHRNLEVVMFDKRDKIIMEADLYFNLQNSTTKNKFSSIFNEQFGETDPNVGITGWLSMKALTKGTYMQTYVHNSLFRDPEAIKSGVDLMISQWKFDKIIPCHGDTVDSNGSTLFSESL